MMTDKTKKIFIGTVLLLLMISVILAVLISITPRDEGTPTAEVEQSGDEVFDYHQRLTFDRVALQKEVENFNDLLSTPTDAQEISQRRSILESKVSSLNTLVNGLETTPFTEQLEVLYIEYIALGDAIVETVGELADSEDNPGVALDKIDEFRELRGELILKDIEILEQTNTAGEETFVPSGEIEQLRNLLNNNGSN